MSNRDAESIVAIDYERIGRAAFQRLHAHNERNRAAGDALRREIARVVREYTGSEELTAKRVLRLLSLERIGRSAVPSERTVQWHLQRLRAEQLQSVSAATRPETS